MYDNPAQLRGPNLNSMGNNFKKVNNKERDYTWINVFCKETKLQLDFLAQEIFPSIHFYYILQYFAYINPVYLTCHLNLHSS